MNSKILKHSLFKCRIPSSFKKKFPDTLGCCAFSEFDFPPFPKTFRTEFWFTLGTKQQVVKDTSKANFVKAYAEFVQEGFTAPFRSEELSIQNYKALKISFLESKEFPAQEGNSVKYNLESQAIAIFLDEQYIMHLYFSYDISQKKEALPILEECLRSLEFYGDASLWHKKITSDKDFWKAQEEEAHIKKRNQRIIQDDRLGVLKPMPISGLKPKENTWWTSDIDFDEHHFTFKLNLGISDTQENKVKSFAIKLLDNFEHLEKEAKNGIANHLLEIYNDSWRQDDLILSEHAFKQQICLNFIEIDKNLQCSFSYDDGDLFGGHHVIVHFKLLDTNQWEIIDVEMFG